MVVANTALVDFTEENGATEFWLGSHAFTDERDQIIATAETAVGKQKVGEPSCNVHKEAFETRRAIRPPILACMNKGDVMLRDFRCWHAGMPNDTDKDRIMVAQIWMVRCSCHLDPMKCANAICCRRPGIQTMRQDSSFLFPSRNFSWAMVRMSMLWRTSPPTRLWNMISIATTLALELVISATTIVQRLGTMITARTHL